MDHAAALLLPKVMQVREQTARQLVRRQTERENSRTDQLTAAARYTLREVRFVAVVNSRSEIAVQRQRGDARQLDDGENSRRLARI
jgi:acyl dehydratase